LFRSLKYWRLIYSQLLKCRKKSNSSLDSNSSQSACSIGNISGDYGSFVIVHASHSRHWFDWSIIQSVSDQPGAPAKKFAPIFWSATRQTL
jgi:hypothetical protein